MKRLEDESDLVLTDMAERLVIELTDVLALEKVSAIAAWRVPEVYSSRPVNAPGDVTLRITGEKSEAFIRPS